MLYVWATEYFIATWPKLATGRDEKASRSPSMAGYLQIKNLKVILW